MIKTFYACEKTNSYYPTPWGWTLDPFPAFRGAGQRYNAFLAVASGFTPWFSSFDLSDNHAMSDDYSKIIKTQKGKLLLVPCSKKEDEKIVLITARGSFRGAFARTEAVGAEILWQNGMDMHCCPVRHIVARITEPDGYVWTETGDRNRSSCGCVEVYSWKGGYFALSTEEYEVAVELGNLFSTHDTIQSDLEKCRAKRQEQAESRTRKASLLPQLEQFNTRLKACNRKAYDVSGPTFFTEENRRGGRPIHHLYSEKELKEVEKCVVSAEKETAMLRTRDRFKEAAKPYSFSEGEDSVGRAFLDYYANCLVVRDPKGNQVIYDYSEEELSRFVADLPAYEAEYQEKLQEKARSEAAEKARKAAEEADRLAREAAAKKREQAEAEAKEQGLPEDVRIWKRVGGRTGCSRGWVIGTDGTDRERDRLYNENSNRALRYDEGYEIWNQLLPGELVIQWTKKNTAADHVCEVLYRPESISRGQLGRVLEIEKELAEEWDGTDSPALNGWLAQLLA